jgi:hypothetical protein
MTSGGRILHSLQGYESQYQPDSCQELLKWKPASHNSVDFKLLHATDELVILDDRCTKHISEGQHYFLGVLERGRIVVAFDFDPSLEVTEDSPPAKVQFQEGVDADALVNIIIECNFDASTGCWIYMRERSKCALPPCSWDCGCRGFLALLLRCLVTRRATAL